MCCLIKARAKWVRKLGFFFISSGMCAVDGVAGCLLSPGGIRCGYCKSCVSEGAAASKISGINS